MISEKIVRGMEKKTLLLECESCHLTSTDSRLLPCSHHFCLKCLEKQINENALDTTASQHCSICGKEWFVPDADGVKGLFCVSKNVYFESFIHSLQSFKKCIMENNESPHEIVEDFCVTCWDSLCTSCALAHCKTKLTQSHVVKKITDISVDDFEHHERHRNKKENADYCLCCDDCYDFACMLCNCTLSHKTNDKDKAVSGQLEAYKKLLKVEHEIDTSLNNHKIFIQIIDEKCSDYLEEIKIYLRTFEENVKWVHEKIITELSQVKNTVSQIIATKKEKEITSRREILEKYKEKLSKVQNLKSILEKQLTLQLSELELLKTECFLGETIEQKNKHELKITGITEWKDKVSEWLKPLLNLSNNLTCPHLNANEISFLCPTISNVQQKIIQPIPTSNKPLINSNVGNLTGAFVYKPIVGPPNPLPYYITQPSMPIPTNLGLNPFQVMHNPLPAYNPHIIQQPVYNMLNTNFLHSQVDTTKLRPQQTGNEPQKPAILRFSARNNIVQQTPLDILSKQHVSFDQPPPTLNNVYNTVLVTDKAKASTAEPKQSLREELYQQIKNIHPHQAEKITGMLMELNNEELVKMLHDFDTLVENVEVAVKTLEAANVKVQDKHEERF